MGLDASPAMLAKARGYDELVEADAATWKPKEPLALIFSNAALHWLDDHAALMPRLAGFVRPGGALAVQMPRQFLAPSNRFLRDIAASLFPDRFDVAQFDAPAAGFAAAQCNDGVIQLHAVFGVQVALPGQRLPVFFGVAGQ